MWSQSDGATQNIWANTFDGNGWNTAKIIEPNSNLGLRPNIAIGANGKGLAFWEDANDDFTQTEVWNNSFDGTNWGSAERFETKGFKSAQPQFVFGGNGDGVALWVERSDDNSRSVTWTRRFDAQLSEWGEAENFEEMMEEEESDLSLDLRGNGFLVGVQDDGTFSNIIAKRFDGMNWKTAELVETNNLGNARNPRIAIDHKGNAIVVWAQSDGDRFNIWANRFE